MLAELSATYDSRQSFYGKAKVVTTEFGGFELYSYDTKVAEIYKDEAIVHGTYSNTTLRHIKEFLLQNGFKAENKAQIMKDYGGSNERVRD